MIFCEDENDKLSNYMQRYSSEEEAIKGHEELVELIKNTLNNDN